MTPTVFCALLSSPLRFPTSSSSTASSAAAATPVRPPRGRLGWLAGRFWQPHEGGGTAAWLPPAVCCPPAGAAVVVGQHLSSSLTPLPPVHHRRPAETGEIYHLTFKPPPPEIVPRLVQRSDDTEEKCVNRLKTYHANVDAVLGYYEQQLVQVGGPGARGCWREGLLR